jgi:hypothetical protein
MSLLYKANQYFMNRLWADNWDDTTDELKRKSLATAQTQIDNLKNSNKFSEDEYNEAIFEQTLFLLELTEEDRLRINIQEQGVKSVNINGSVSESYDLTGEVGICNYAKSLQSKYRRNFTPGDMT